jgi:hypothetical protein
LARELRAQAHVLVCWNGRMGGGQIDGSTVTVRLPGEAHARATCDAELVAIRRLELLGTVEVTWPFRCWRTNEPHAPIAEHIEALAELL